MPRLPQAYITIVPLWIFLGHAGPLFDAVIHVPSIPTQSLSVVVLSPDRSEWCVVETPLRLRHSNAHAPTIIQSRVKACFALTGGVPKITAA